MRSMSMSTHFLLLGSLADRREKVVACFLATARDSGASSGGPFRSIQSWTTAICSSGQAPSQRPNRLVTQSFPLFPKNPCPELGCVPAIPGLNRDEGCAQKGGEDRSFWAQPQV